MEFREYLKTFEKNLKKFTGFNLFLTTEDIKIIKNWYDNNIPLDFILKLTYKEVLTLPKNKRKFFSIRKLNKKLERLITKKSLNKTLTEDTNTSQNKEVEFLKGKLQKLGVDFNIDNFDDEEKVLEYLRKRLINYIWKNMPVDEKKNLKKEALRDLKKYYNLNNINKKETLKILIAEKIKKIYNIP